MLLSYVFCLSAIIVNTTSLELNDHQYLFTVNHMKNHYEDTKMNKMERNVAYYLAGNNFTWQNWASPYNAIFHATSCDFPYTKENKCKVAEEKFQKYCKTCELGGWRRKDITGDKVQVLSLKGRPGFRCRGRKAF